MTQTVNRRGMRALPQIRRDASDQSRRRGSPASRYGASPPEVPPEFWETDEMRAALRSRHMGKVIRAYRRHLHHGYRGLSQEDLAHWAGISQGKVSRLETGDPLLRLDQLIDWALLLGIPTQYLWFDLPDTDRLNAWPGRRRTTVRHG